MEGTPRGPFPNELWVKIFEYLQYRLKSFKRTDLDHDHHYNFGDRFTLAKAARVNRNFNTIATRSLYHSLQISEGIMPYPLVRTLIEHPDLAQLVRQVDITEQPLKPYELTNFLGVVLEECSTHSQHLVPFFEFILDRTRQKHRRFTSAEQMAVFLYLLPNLRAAQLDVWVSGSMMEILDTWPGSMLSRVEDLRLRHHRCGSNAEMCAHDYLTKLPNLRTFHGSGVYWENFQCPAPELRHLVLMDTLPGTRGLHKILSRCAHLETLKIDPVAEPKYSIDFSSVGEYIRSLGLNLVELDLGPASSFANFAGTLGSLEKLTRLRELSLPWDIMARNFVANMKKAAVSTGGHPPALKLVGQLPSSLEHLSLYKDEMDLEGWQFLQLVQSDRLSRLKSVRFTHLGECEEYDQVAFRQGLSRRGWDVRYCTEKGRNSVDISYQYEWMVLEKRRA